MNKLYLALDSISKENELRVKAKTQRRIDLISVAWKTLKANKISVFDYARICDKNSN